eukprot:CAMPEP_0115228268 /NCGR_PEP_ID=MMETSP0270-20121206/31582_1 /TAXON_ID=71861 /ORGANISM="Scrippsiella trochoidea, Strain CCMP3099" /LENGTH=377 /DNA_ID=CAMNT_0002642763 /DNA_START=524 /DNA_END=1657 /DNA_ORIENTATION=-
MTSRTTSSLFAAMWFECSEVAVDEAWSNALRHSFFLHSFPSVTLHHAIIFSWSVTILDVLYPLLVSLPRYDQQPICKDVVENPVDGSVLYFQNMFGTSLTSGHLFVAMGESAGMGTVEAQNPRYAAIRAEMSWDDFISFIQRYKDVSQSSLGEQVYYEDASCCSMLSLWSGRPSYHAAPLVQQVPLEHETGDCKDQMSSILAQKLACYYQHVDGVFPMAFTRLGLRGLLKHTLQVNVQITMLGIAQSTAAHGHELSPLALVSILVCFIGAFPLCNQARVVIQFASRAPARLENFYNDPSGIADSLNEAQKPDVSVLRRKICLVGVLLALLIWGQVYAYIKLIMTLFVCKDHGLWNLPLSLNLEQGCVVPISHQQVML